MRATASQPQKWAGHAGVAAGRISVGRRTPDKGYFGTRCSTRPLPARSRGAGVTADAARRAPGRSGQWYLLGRRELPSGRQALPSRNMAAVADVGTQALIVQGAVTPAAAMRMPASGHAEYGSRPSRRPGPPGSGQPGRSSGVAATTANRSARRRLRGDVADVHRADRGVADRSEEPAVGGDRAGEGQQSLEEQVGPQEGVAGAQVPDRSWALAQPHRCRLLYGPPLPGYDSVIKMPALFL
jgi:hypothetical protein